MTATKSKKSRKNNHRSVDHLFGRAKDRELRVNELRASKFQDVNYRSGVKDNKKSRELTHGRKGNAFNRLYNDAYARDERRTEKVIEDNERFKPVKMNTHSREIVSGKYRSPPQGEYMHHGHTHRDTYISPVSPNNHHAATEGFYADYQSQKCQCLDEKKDLNAFVTRTHYIESTRKISPYKKQNVSPGIPLKRILKNSNRAKAKDQKPLLKKSKQKGLRNLSKSAGRTTDTYLQKIAHENAPFVTEREAAHYNWAPGSKRRKHLVSGRSISKSHSRDSRVSEVSKRTKIMDNTYFIDHNDKHSHSGHRGSRSPVSHYRVVGEKSKNRHQRIGSTRLEIGNIYMYESFDRENSKNREYAKFKSRNHKHIRIDRSNASPKSKYTVYDIDVLYREGCMSPKDLRMAS